MISLNLSIDEAEFLLKQARTNALLCIKKQMENIANPALHLKYGELGDKFTVIADKLEAQGVQL